MQQDPQSFRRAAHAALIGLGTQCFVLIATILLAIYTRSDAVGATLWYVLGGLPIWFVLWVLFNQHRLEREEALEAEQLAQADASAAALFDEAGQQLQQARKRLEGLYKWGLGLVSVLVGVYLVGLGGALFYLNYGKIVETADGGRDFTALFAGAMRPAANVPLLLGIFFGLAFMAFLVARYIAGMTRVDQWQPLRGGASYLMGNMVALAGVFIATGVLFAASGNLVVFAALALIIPAMMVVLGAETLLSFVFGIYRPRRSDEVVRPAFDSRLLGWLTRPESLGKIIGETLNYQFGFEISRSWFYALLSKSIVPLILAGIALVFALSCVVIVPPQQQGVVTFNGRITKVVAPGVAFKAPWPLGQVETFDVYRVEQITVGSLSGAKDADAILWTNEHGEGEERYLVTAPTQVGERTQQTDIIAGELAGVELTVNYRIKEDPQAIQNQAINGGPRLTRNLMTNIAMSRLNRYTATHDIDALLHEARENATRDLAQQIQADANVYNLGVEVVYAGLTSVHPPQREEVAAKFHEQIGALQEKQVAIEQANAEAIATLAAVAGSRERAMEISAAIERYEQLRQQDGKTKEAAQQLARVEELLENASGEAAEVLQAARARRWQYALEELGRAGAFEAQVAAFETSPQYFRTKQTLEVLRTLQDRRKVILDTDQAQDATLRFNLQDTGAGLGSLFDTEN